MLTAIQVRKIQLLTRKNSSSRLPLIFGALSDSTRFCIFRILLSTDNLCVTDVAKICGLSVAAASHQLKILEMVGLLRKERRGKTICYKLQKHEPTVGLINKLINHPQLKAEHFRWGGKPIN